MSEQKQKSNPSTMRLDIPCKAIYAGFKNADENEAEQVFF